MFLETHEKGKDYPAHEEVGAEQLDGNNSLAVMASLVGERKRVLDVGCAGGYFAKLLERIGCEVVGIDANPAALEQARRFCVSTHVIDLDQAHMRDVLPEGSRFDVIVFGDVLEHLRDPMRLLEDARSLLAEEGYVVASVPNIAHGAIRLALLSGAFDYQRLGILDDTHLRFFTAKTLEELFLSAGFRLTRTERTKLAVFDPSDLLPRINREDFNDVVVEEILADAESDTLQFVVQAHPLADGVRVRSLTKRFLEVNTDFAVMRRSLASRDADLTSERARTEQLTEELERTRLHLREADEEMRKAQAVRVTLLEEQRASTLGIEHARLLERVEHLTLERDRLRSAMTRLEPFELAAARLEERETFLKAALEETRANVERECAARAALERRQEELLGSSEALRASLEASERTVSERSTLLERRREELAHAFSETAMVRERAAASERAAAERAALLERREDELARTVAETAAARERAATAERAAAEHAASLERCEKDLARVTTEMMAARERAVAAERTAAERAMLLERQEKDLAFAASELTAVRERAEASERSAAAAKRHERELTQTIAENARAHADLLRERESALQQASEEAARWRARAQETERRFADQSALAVADSRAESARLALLIDTVQSSRFWRLKRFFRTVFRKS